MSASTGVLAVGDPLMSFAFGDHIVRVLTDQEDPWFVLADICRALAITNAGNVATRLRESGAGVRQADIRSGGQIRSVTAVDESGLYEVIIRSDKPDARRFRRWVTAEVLPAIRKTGSYSRYPAHPTAAALPSKRELAQWVIDAEDRAERAEARAAELAAPASAWNELAEAAGDYGVSDAAKVLSRDSLISTGERRLFQFMAGIDWVYRRDGRWRAKQSQVDCGRLVEKVNRAYENSAGDMVVPAPTIRITPKGLAELHRRLGGSGQLELVAAG